MTIAHVDDVDVHGVVHGDGKPVLVLHGAGVDHREAEACFEPALRPHGRLRRIYPDLPGFGPWPVFEHFVTADKLVNLPVTKQHGLATTTTGMKNWYGALGGMRRELHPRMDESIVALAQLFRPTLTVVDSTRILMRNGALDDDVAASLVDMLLEGAGR